MDPNNKPIESEMGRVQGILEGVDKKIDHMRKDIIHIKNNDKDKLQRLATLETEQKILEKWRDGHIKANQRTNKQMKLSEENFEEKVGELRSELGKYQKGTNNWLNRILVAIIILFIGVLVDLSMRGLFG